MIYGYARVSTAAQDESGQVRQLKAAGCEKIFREKITGTTADRPQLAKLMAALTHGDVVIIPAVDRHLYIAFSDFGSDSITGAGTELRRENLKCRNGRSMSQYDTIAAMRLRKKSRNVRDTNGLPVKYLLSSIIMR